MAMPEQPKIQKPIRVRDKNSGKLSNIGEHVVRRGIEATAKEFRVSKNTVRNWLKGVHRPSSRTLVRSLEQLF